jgi:hypothetical protein
VRAADGAASGLGGFPAGENQLNIRLPTATGIGSISSVRGWPLA